MEKIKTVGELIFKPTKKFLKLIESEKNPKVKNLLLMIAHAETVNHAGEIYRDLMSIPEYDTESDWGEMVKETRTNYDFFCCIYSDIQSEVMRENTDEPAFNTGKPDLDLEFINRKMKKYREEIHKCMPENTPEWADKYRAKHR